ncbi:glycerophosphodiester phosphodiesterase [Oculatella sp. FACHB-28]|uniref:glycerophosphodiester phosphodiesterase family protein n=1 Tax=Oculatella sp. FACHB-28 TaxID=2692845 RepID=UPI001686CF4F|nr:glycerophosphodiester phosphodiesterase family protein [Oculatella sp. FACHB-28]MBD2058799.1 glycerophosphodiester phosphodiesterase [Oculatella sp. FACHB-28]
MSRLFKLAFLAAAALAILPAAKAEAITLSRTPTLNGELPIVIGHRGASGYRPEHTLAAYELAIDMGADYIEPDLVSTKDGVLIARHENAIAIVDPTTGAVTEATTNVAELPQFADRRTTKVIDGVSITGWFTEDFTLEELKTLKARERIPQIRPQNVAFNDRFEVPTLQEVIDLAKRKSEETGRTIGIYPETKHPTYFDSIGLSLEEPLVETLNANGYVGEDAPVFVQSFEVGNLQLLNTLTDVPLVQLFSDADDKPYDFIVNGDTRTYGDLTTPSGLNAIANYADGIGPFKRLIIPTNEFNQLLTPTSLVSDAHNAGLLVHPYTFRDEDVFLAEDYGGNAELEYEQFFKLGIDGLFSDNPDTAFAVRNRIAGNPNQSVPEPGMLLALGLVPLAGLLRRRNAQSKA